MTSVPSHAAGSAATAPSTVQWDTPSSSPSLPFPAVGMMRGCLRVTWSATAADTVAKPTPLAGRLPLGSAETLRPAREGRRSEDARGTRCLYSSEVQYDRIMGIHQAMPVRSHRRPRCRARGRKGEPSRRIQLANQTSRSS